MSHSDLPIPDQLIHLAEMLKASTVIESMPRLQLSSISERDNIRKAIDSGINILADLKSYRNAVASISFLPDELLSDIFYHLMLLSDPWSPTWCRVLLVCREWYRVAINEGKLWSWFSESYDPDKDFDRLEVWKNRSKGYPLSYKFTTNFHRMVFFGNTHRIRYLQLNGQTKDLQDFFLDVAELPIVESLKFHIYKSSTEGNGEQQPWRVPSFIVQGGAPRLRNFCLDDVAFASVADLCLLNNLTHLELGRHITDQDLEDSIPLLKDIYDILKCSPALQTLKIRHYISLHSTALDQVPPLSLPSLQLLDLNLDIQLIIMLLQSIVLLPTTRTSFIAHRRYDGHSSYLHDIKSLMIPIRRHTRHKDASILRSVRIECGSYLALSFSPEPTCPALYLGDDDQLSTHILLYPSSQRETRHFLAKVFHALPLETLESLDANMVVSNHRKANVNSEDQQFSPETWRELVRLLPPGLTIRIGVNDAMVAMLEGALGAMKKAPNTLPHGRRRRQQCRVKGFGPGSLPCSKLILSASRNLSILRSQSDAEREQQQEELYNSLLAHLATFRDLDTGLLKPAGTSLKILAVENMQGYYYGRKFAPQLFELTEELSFEGVVWDPVTIRKNRRKRRRRTRKLKKKYPEMGLPDSDPDASPLSSNSESDDIF